MNTRSEILEHSKNVIDEFDRAYSVQSNDFERGHKSWRRYFPVNYGKWDADALKTLEEEFRHPVQFDVVGPKVDTLAGSIVSDLPDPNWVPVEGDSSITTEAIAESYFIDRDLYNYDQTLLYCIRDGLVHAADVELYEDSRFHAPRIALGRVLYGFLVWDPYWMSDDDRDAEVCYRVAYMTADQIARKYRHATDDIKREAAEYRRDMGNYPSAAYDQQKKLSIGRVGDQFQVIEKHYLEHIKTTRLLGRQEGKAQWIPFPINKDRAYLELFGEVNRIDWTTVIEDTYDDRIHYVSTVCRELGGVYLQSGAKSKIQVNGLPFYHFTAFRYGGQNMGLPELQADIEDTINKRESLVTELISKANGGSTLVNELLFPDPKKRQEWSKKVNKPGHKEFVPLDSVKNVMEHLASNNYSPAVLDQINRMYQQVLPLVSRVSDAFSSITSSEDSGILFERKFQTNMVANTLLNRSVRQLINNMAEGYFYQYQITYGDQQREIKFRDGRRVTVNKRVGDQVYNSVRSVPRCRVVISENTKSATYQMRWRSVWAEMLQVINPQVAPAHYMLALNNFFKTIQMDEGDKGESKVLGELMLMIARLELVSRATGFQAQAQGNTLQSMQIQQQIDVLMQQLGSMFEQPQPVGHMGGAEEAEGVVEYPEENEGGEESLYNIEGSDQEAGNIEASDTETMSASPMKREG